MKNLVWIFSGIYLVFTITFFVFNLIEPIKFLAAIVGLGSLLLAFQRYVLSLDETSYKLINDFNSRYTSDLNDLLNDIRDTGTDSFELDTHQKNLIIDYLNLCAEEYYWYTKNRIPKDIWVSWKNGIKHNLQLNSVKKIASQEFAGNGINDYKRNSYYGFPDSDIWKEIDQKI
jgi:hypothetical protein